MLALRNNNKLAGNNGKPLVNAEITSLQVVNTNGFQFKIVSTGPIRVYWGDGTYTDVSTQASLYTINKTYSISGTYNIIVTNQGSVTTLQFNHATYAPKINTNVSWFKQFYNLQFISLSNANFNGELANIIEKMISVTRLFLVSYTAATSLRFNVSNCKLFWNRCVYVYLNNAAFLGLISGSVTDINLNLDCEVGYFFFMNITGDISGILKSGYTKITSLTYYTTASTTHVNFINFEDLVIPNTLTYSYFRGITSFGRGDNFNFKNYIAFRCENGFSDLVLDNNLSFTNSIQNNITDLILMGSNIKINLNLFTKTSYNSVTIGGILSGNNKTYGDITVLAQRTNQLTIVNGDNTDAIYGNVAYKSNRSILWLSGINCSITSTEFLLIVANPTMTALYLSLLPNLKGNISNAYFGANYIYPALTMNYMSIDLVADITTFSFNTTFYTTTYNGILFNNNPSFTGNLGNLTLWSNKSYIYLQNCAYTNIGGFVNNVFTQRNTCLKATGGVTSINVAGNIDNASLTGTYQRGSLGTYGGNQNDLTEAQIDNLAAGLDYTGSGSSTAWTHKEKIYWLVNCKNSSTDSSSRYRVNITY